MIIIERFNKEGTRFVPYWYKETCCFKMGYPTIGSSSGLTLPSKKRKLIMHEIEVGSNFEILINLIKGYHLRMAPVGSTSPVLIQPESIIVRFEAPYP